MTDYMVDSQNMLCRISARMFRDQKSRQYAILYQSLMHYEINKFHLWKLFHVTNTILHNLVCKLFLFLAYVAMNFLFFIPYLHLVGHPSMPISMIYPLFDLYTSFWNIFYCSWRHAMLFFLSLYEMYNAFVIKIICLLHSVNECSSVASSAFICFQLKSFISLNGVGF